MFRTWPSGHNPGILYVVPEHKDLLRHLPLSCRAAMGVAVTLACSWAVLSVVASAQVPGPQAGLKITVLEGEGAINNVSQRRAKEAVVQVVDENNMPVKGASVTFLLPDTGPSGEFSAGGRTLAVVTDEKGQAADRGLVPNQSIGNYQIRVVASYQRQTASAVINQTNAQPAGGTSHGITSKKFLLIGVIGGAAAVGVALAAMGHGGSTPSGPANPPGPGIVIATGTPAFQPPH